MAKSKTKYPKLIRVGVEYNRDTGIEAFRAAKERPAA